MAIYHGLQPAIRDETHPNHLPNVTRCARDGSITRVDILDSPILSKMYSPKISLEFAGWYFNISIWYMTPIASQSLKQKNRFAKGHGKNLKIFFNLQLNWVHQQKNLCVFALGEVLQVPCSARHPPNGAASWKVHLKGIQKEAKTLSRNTHRFFQGRWLLLLVFGGVKGNSI